MLLQWKRKLAIGYLVDINNIMKTLLTLFVLFFSPSVFAEDVSDFQIEGMSVGDSLLDYFLLKQINSATNFDNYPSDMKFRIIELSAENGPYEWYQFYIIPSDKKFIIHALNGRIFYSNINKCYKEMKEIENILTNIFLNSKKIIQSTAKHPDDPSGKSTYKGVFFEIKKSGRASVICYDWQKEDYSKKQIAISIQSLEVSKWVDSNYGVN